MHLSPRRLIILGMLACAPLLNASAPGAAQPISIATVVGLTAVPLPSQTATPLPTTSPGETATAVPITPPTVSAAALPGNPTDGAKLFDNLPCSSCHDDTHPFPGGTACPNLGNVATEAARIVESLEYHGQATDAVGSFARRLAVK